MKQNSYAILSTLTAVILFAMLTVGTTLAQEISVSGYGVDISDGDTSPDYPDGTQFPALLPSSSFTQTFTIENTDGANPLNITSIVVSGTHSSEFVISGFTPGAIAAASSTTFDVVFTPANDSPRDREATITINSDDADEAAFNFDVIGYAHEPFPTGCDPRLTPTTGTADVDGDIGEWDITDPTDDFFACMFNAGNRDDQNFNGFELLSKVYMRTTCDPQTGKHTIYAMVLAEDGKIPEMSADDAWIKIYDLSNSPQVDGNSGDDGVPPDFQWVEISNELRGYEGSFTLDPGVYNMEVHLNILDGNDSKTSSTGKRGETISLVLGECSQPPSCTLNEPVIETVCDDNDTPSDPSDDTFSYTINVTGANTGATYSISGDDSQSGFTYNFVQGPFGPFNIADGDLNLTITDVDDSNCSTSGVATAPATCSDDCALNDPVMETVCDDNDTPSDPSDDTFTYTINVTGANTGATYSISGDDSQSGLAYNTVQGPFGPFNIADGDLSLTITDVDDSNCSTSGVATAPATCSDDCALNDPVIETVCDDNDTPSDPSDDTFSYTINVTGANTGATYSISGDDSQSGFTYNFVQGPFGPFNIADGDLNLTITDVDDSNCSTSGVATAPATCSDDCDLNDPVIETVCDDNDTPSDPSDDTFSYTIIVTGSNTGATYSIGGDDGRSGLAYNVLHGPFGSFPIADGDLSLTITDVDDSNCSTSGVATAPATCSDDCDLNAGEDASLIVCEGDIVDLDTVVTVAGGTYSLEGSEIGNIVDTDGYGGEVLMISYTVPNDSDCPDGVANICILVNPKPPTPNVEDISICEDGDTEIVPIPSDPLPVLPHPFEVKWNFENQDLSGSTNIPAIVPSDAVAGTGLENIGFAPGVDDLGYSYRATSWADATDNYFEFCIEATNGVLDLNGLQVRSFRFPTGPGKYRFEIATNGSTTFNQVGGDFIAFQNFWNGGGLFGPIAEDISSLCVRVVAFDTVEDTASYKIDNFIIIGTHKGVAPTLSYNFYDANPAIGPANLLAEGVSSYDPMTEAGDSPEMIWVTCVDMVTMCESDPVKVTVTVDELDPCDIQGEPIVCPGGMFYYEVPDDGYDYMWSIDGAEIVGAKDGHKVKVKVPKHCGKFKLTLKVKDGDCESMCMKEVKVEDNEKPMLHGIPKDEVVCDAKKKEDHHPEVWATDNCDDDVKVTVKITEEGKGTPHDPLRIICTWTATDDCGNSVSKSQTVTVDPSKCGMDKCILYPYEQGEFSVWIQNVPGVKDDNYYFLGNGNQGGVGYFHMKKDGTARITGTLVNRSDPSIKWKVDIRFHSTYNWEEWKALGGKYKVNNQVMTPGELQLAHQEHVNWLYFMMDEEKSKFIGLSGAVDGVVLHVKERSNKHRLQKGIAANDKDGDYGLSGWFKWMGEFDGNMHSGYGDVNADIVCRDKPDNDPPSNKLFSVELGNEDVGAPYQKAMGIEAGTKLAAKMELEDREGSVSYSVEGLPAHAKIVEREVDGNIELALDWDIDERDYGIHDITIITIDEDGSVSEREMRVEVPDPTNFSSDFLYFDLVMREDNTAELAWETSAELEGTRFILEYSGNNDIFSPFETIKGKGNIKEGKAYVYEDSRVITGRSFYRVKMILPNGGFSYSEVRLASVKEDIVPQMRIFPNPAADILEVRLPAESKGTYSLKMIDISGREVFRQSYSLDAGLNSIQVDVSDFAEGVYMIFGTGEGYQDMERFTKN